MKIRGKYNTADAKIEITEDGAAEQIQSICNLEYMKDAVIKIMPDTHIGKGICIGFTAKLRDKICPNFVGVDISCSISAYKIDSKIVDFAELDGVIKKHIPYSMYVRKEESPLIPIELADDIRELSKDMGDPAAATRFLKALGTLGGGNHFIEMNKDKEGNLWLSIHCGSRNLGKRVCEYHQRRAISAHDAKVKKAWQEALSTLEDKDKEQWIISHRDENSINEALRYVEGAELDLYIKHMKVAQRFAETNHAIIVSEICTNMGWSVTDSIFTNHNYIEFLDDNEMIIRKGAISAKLGERLLIPLNMRDGILLGTGKGNDDWNSSAPHGAGRILSRSKARKVLSEDTYKEEMKNVWSSCVSSKTIDEAPMAYKSMELIIDAVQETADISDRLLPVYNFKAN